MYKYNVLQVQYYYFLKASTSLIAFLSLSKALALLYRYAVLCMCPAESSDEQNATVETITVPCFFLRKKHAASDGAMLLVTV
jgi:hypothetical protein